MAELLRLLPDPAATPAPSATKPQTTTDDATAVAPDKPEHPCPGCGGRMVIIETFEAGCTPRHRPSPPATGARIDTS